MSHQPVSSLHWIKVYSAYKRIILMCTNCIGRNAKPIILANAVSKFRTMLGKITFTMCWKLWTVLSKKGKLNTSDFLMKIHGESCVFWKKANTTIYQE